VGSRANENTSSPTIAAIWLRTIAPMHTPKAPRKAAITRLRQSTSARSPAPTVVSSRADRISVPTAMIVTVTMNEITAPATA